MYALTQSHHCWYSEHAPEISKYSKILNILVSEYLHIQ